MPTQVLKPAPGFLGMVDAQQMGRNPALITDEVLPSVDMLPFWMSQRGTMDVIIGPNVLAAATPTTIGTLIVPEGEVWIPLSASVRGTVNNINSTFGLRIQTSIPARQSPQSANNQVHYLLNSFPSATTLVANQEISLEYSWQQRVVWLPGRRVAGSITYLAAGATFSSTRFSFEYLAFPA